jgi:hypothetical protein
MGYALISGTSKSTGGFGPLTTDAISTVGADLIVVHASHLTLAVTSVSDNQGGNTYTQLIGSSKQVGTVSSSYWYLQAPATSATHTFSVDEPTTAVLNIDVLAFSGSRSTPQQHENGAASGSAATLATGSITPGEDNCLVVAGLVHNDPSSPLASVDGGFTIGTKVDAVAATSFGSQLAYLIQTTATAANPTWTVSPAMFMTVGIVDFTPALGPGPAMGGRFHRIVTRPAAFRPGIAR